MAIFEKRLPVAVISNRYFLLFSRPSATLLSLFFSPGVTGGMPRALEVEENPVGLSSYQPGNIPETTSFSFLQEFLK